MSRNMEAEHARRANAVATMAHVGRDEIADALGIPLQTLVSWAHHHQIPLPSKAQDKRRKQTEDRVAAIEAMAAKGYTRLDMASELGLTRTGLESWAKDNKVKLPRQMSARLVLGERTCRRCQVRKMPISSSTGKPPAHGLCTTCRAVDLGRICTRGDCNQGATHGPFCSSHRHDLEGIDRANIPHHAVAFALYDPEPHPVFGPYDHAVRHWFVDCAACDWNRYGMREQVNRWRDEHNAEKHSEATC